jgi:hypothetical protein
MRGTEELIIVTSDRAFAGAQSYTIDELLEYRWILRERGSRTRDALLYQMRGNWTTSERIHGTRSYRINKARSESLS